MPATLNDIQRKYGESVYPLYKDEMHEPYMEDKSRDDSIVIEDNKIALLYKKLGYREYVAKELKMDRRRVKESLKRSGGKIKILKKVSYGYQGVVLYDGLEDKVQCSLCGKWFASMTAHLYFSHKMSVNGYKKEFSLLKKIPLCSKNRSRQMSETAIKNNLERNLVSGGKVRYKPTPKDRKKNAKAAAESKKTVAYKNKYGLCGDLYKGQIVARLIVVRDAVKVKAIADIKSSDLRREDCALYYVMKQKYGTVALACKALGLNFDRGIAYKDSEIIVKLRKFVAENRRMPYKGSDFKDMKLGVGTLYNHFGSFKRAKVVAGLDQLLEEVKGK